ncbi:hypothetical protein [Emticicia fluvialis]|uniref:hypothetical protein n=1 Tax=Emticicia fluvialis TaxID=2974474 RepID=UPI00216596E3|nr:hypothetical protein [Emticicia fluvialis]
MDQVKSFFDSFKEFIWDIIGYLLPGSYLLILLQYVIYPIYLIEVNKLNNLIPNFHSYSFIILAYILGHGAYGLGLIKEEILRRCSYITYKEKIEETVSHKKPFLIAKKLIVKNLTENGLDENFDSATVKDIRNIIMSYYPEYNQKVYSFTFRSELSNQAGNISFLIGIFGILFSILNNSFSFFQLFQSDVIHVILYICLICSYLFFRQTRNRFYKISLELPFSIYTASEIKK